MFTKAIPPSPAQATFLALSHQHDMIVSALPDDETYDVIGVILDSLGHPTKVSGISTHDPELIVFHSSNGDELPPSYTVVHYSQVKITFLAEATQAQDQEPREPRRVGFLASEPEPEPDRMIRAVDDDDDFLPEEVLPRW